MPPRPRSGRFAAAHRAKPHLINQPLLRPRFHPTGPYRVSFVDLHAGVQFARRGDLRMTLPRMDVPVRFVPEHYSTRAVDGNVISTQRALVSYRDVSDLRRIGGVAGGHAAPSVPIIVSMSRRSFAAVDGRLIGSYRISDERASAIRCELRYLEPPAAKSPAPSALASRPKCPPIVK